jgi:hypothetical protein
MSALPSIFHDSDGLFEGKDAQVMETCVASTNNVYPSLHLVQDPGIDRALSQIVCACVSKLHASLVPHPLAIVLTGSFARGEGSVLRDGVGLKVLGDMEFMVFFDVTSDLDDLQAVLTERTVQLEEYMLTAGIECKLEFSAVNLQYLSKLKPHIFGYELLSHGRVIYGNKVLNSACHFESDAIPKWDAWRMLNNRLIEQLELVGTIEHGSHRQLQNIFYQVVKCYLDTATTLLIFAGRYRDTYAKRASELRIWASEPHGLSDLFWLQVVAARVDACTAFKLNPDPFRGLLGVWLYDSDESHLRTTVRAALVDLVLLLGNVWRWETLQLSGYTAIGADHIQLCKAVMSLQPWKEKLRGWAKLALIPAIRHQPGFIQRMLRLCPLGSPRYLIYCVASSLFFSLPQLMAEQKLDLFSLERFLPVSFDRYSDELDPWWRLRNNVLDGWHLFLRNHWA